MIPRRFTYGTIHFFFWSSLQSGIKTRLRVGLGWVLYLKENNYHQTKRPTLNHSQIQPSFTLNDRNGARPLQLQYLSFYMKKVMIWIWIWIRPCFPWVFVNQHRATARSLGGRKFGGHSISRVCTDFWIPNLRLFQDFIQNSNFFFQNQGHLSNTWSIETLTNAGTKLFYDALQTYGRD